MTQDLDKSEKYLDLKPNLNETEKVKQNFYNLNYT